MNRFLFLLLLFCSCAVDAMAQCWAKVSAGPIHTLAIKTDGTLWAWGTNAWGQLGTGDYTDRHFPVQVGNATDWTAISAGYSHSMALKTNGSLWVWGENGMGQLGDGTNTAATLPVQLPGNNWSAFSAGVEYSLAVKTDGTLWAWGVNNFGQLGDGSTANSNSPVQIGLASNWAIPHASSENQAVLKTDGTIWTWGTNLNGEMGGGNNTPSLVPVQMGTDNNWASLSNGGGNMLAVKTNGTLWAWGLNNHGQLGDGTNTNRNSPVQTGTDNDWSQVSAGNCTVARKTDGTLWAWGDNGSGQAGNNTFGDQSLPVQTGFLATDWTGIITNGYSVFGIRNGNDLWGWGSNSLYQLGDGSTTERRVPVSVTCLNILPVTGMQFRGKIQEHIARIEWYTETETNCSYFELQHSVDGLLFTKLAKVPAKGGSHPADYTFNHSITAAGKNYYRLKQVDIDGKAVYSTTLVLDNNRGKSLLLFPNPVQGQTILRLNGYTTPGIISLYTANGLLVVKQHFTAGSTHITIDMSRQPAGLYYLRLQCGTESAIQQLIKQ